MTSNLDLLNTSDISDTSDDEEIINDNKIYEFKIDNKQKICGLNKSQDNIKSRNDLKNPYSQSKILKKKEIEELLKKSGISAYQARNNFKIDDACNFI